MIRKITSGKEETRFGTVLCSAYSWSKNCFVARGYSTKNLLKSGWSVSLTILTKWRSLKIKIKSQSVGKCNKESLS